MGQRKKHARQQALARRQAKKRWRAGLFFAVPLGVAAVILVISLTSQAGYSDFDVIGKQPTIVQVFAPG